MKKPTLHEAAALVVKMHRQGFLTTPDIDDLDVALQTKKPTGKIYSYTETGQGFYRFELWFGRDTGKGFLVGLIHSENQANKICKAMNAYGEMFEVKS